MARRIFSRVCMTCLLACALFSCARSAQFGSIEQDWKLERIAYDRNECLTNGYAIKRTHNGRFRILRPLYLACVSELTMGVERGRCQGYVRLQEIFESHTRPEVFAPYCMIGTLYREEFVNVDAAVRAARDGSLTPVAEGVIWRIPRLPDDDLVLARLK